jgi:hypothetical protein
MSSCPPSMDLKRRLTESNILSSKIRAVICENDQLIMYDFEEGGIFLLMGCEGIYSLGGEKPSLSVRIKFSRSQAHSGRKRL